FDNDGVIGGNEVFKDRRTGSRWQQSSLEAISGPLEGEHLELYPFLLTSWQEWQRLHPTTLVLKPLPGYADRIPAVNALIKRGLSEDGPLPAGVTYRDDRLPPKTMVLGIDINGMNKAFPLEALRRDRVVNDSIGGTPVVLINQQNSDTTTAFVARAGGRRLTLTASSPDATELIDRETESHWNAYGRCVAGQLKGSTLAPLTLEP